MNTQNSRTTTIVLTITLLLGSGLQASRGAELPLTKANQPTTYHEIEIDGVNVFYREAGPKDAPTLVLLHGFPTSSHMFRTLIPRLSDKYHVIAPDYPGYGNSDAPPHDAFEYSFESLANVVDQLLESLHVERYSLYLMDYGAPIGFRIAAKHPERVTGLVIQNGNAYEEGIDNDFWKPIKRYWADQTPEHREALRGLLSREATIWQYQHGTRNADAISPDNWNVDQPLLDRPGNQEVQLDLFLSYGSNPPLYAQWQEYFRQHQPPALIVWGKNDQIFPAAGAYPYQRDLKQVELHLLDTGHFALEEELDFISASIREFMDRTNR